MCVCVFPAYTSATALVNYEYVLGGYRENI